MRPVDYTLDDFDFIKPKTDLKAKPSVSRQHAEASSEVYDYPGYYKENADGDAQTKVRIEEMQADQTLARGDGCVRNMYSGGLFTLSEYPRRDQNAEYLLVSLTHHLE